MIGKTRRAQAVEVVVRQASANIDEVAAGGGSAEIGTYAGGVIQRFLRIGHALLWTAPANTSMEAAEGADDSWLA